MSTNDSNSRRDFLKKGALYTIATTGIIASAGALARASDVTEKLSALIDVSKFTLPPLPYAYDALEPHIDKMTMEIHHTKHHQAYINNLNKACEQENISGSLDSILATISKYSVTVRNNAGGHWNHSFFWKIMKPNGGGAPTGKLAEAINATFTTFEDFKLKFNDTAMKRFGSGWSWLALDLNGTLEIGSTANQDNHLMEDSNYRGTPILGIDVWEHAYYLKYQNRRADYINAWWNVINWDEVAKNYASATAPGK